MKDKEVIKALECCVDWCGNVSCWDCPLKNTGCIHFDKLKETLDLINRQKAEIERLRYNLEAVLDERADHSEAIKEFAERLKKSIKKSVDDTWHSDGNGIYDAENVLDDIDNLLKEMAGDNNA